jgi:Fe-S-cluster containining protein
MNDSQKTDSGSSQRVRFPDEEGKFPWLSMLLDAYAIIDEGVAVAIKAEEDDLNIKLACREGCDNCCRTHKDIPLYPLEVIGISWYATEKISGPLRATLKEQLASHREEDPCPFLISGSCSIHLIRPVACRQFNVFYEPCEEGEDPYFTRRDDVLTPIREYTNRAFSVVLPFYGVPGDADRDQAVDHIIRAQALNLQSFDWKDLVKIMEAFDSRQFES